MLQSAALTGDIRCLIVYEYIHLILFSTYLALTTSLKKKKKDPPFNQLEEPLVKFSRKKESSTLVHTMRDTPSKFIEILDPKDSHLRMSDSDVRLEDVLADHEATISRPRSSTQSSKPIDKAHLGRANSTSPTQRWKRFSNMLAQPRRNS